MIGYEKQLSVLEVYFSEHRRPEKNFDFLAFFFEVLFNFGTPKKTRAKRAGDPAYGAGESSGKKAKKGQVHYTRRLLKPVLAQSYAVLLAHVPTHSLRPLFIGGPLHLSVRLGVDLRTLTTNSLGLGPFYSSLCRCIPSHRRV